MTYINQLAEPERIREIERLFRTVFSTTDGKIVLTAILEHLGYFDQAPNDEARVLRNAANWLAGQVFSGDSFALVEAMMNVHVDRRDDGQEIENGRNSGD